MHRSVVQGIAPLLASIVLMALLGCEEPPSPGGAPKTAEPRAINPIEDVSLTLAGPSANKAIDVAGNFNDPDGQTLNFTARSSARAIATASTSGSTVTVTAVAEGTATITVTATDEDNLSASQTFTVTVNPAPPPEPTEQAPVPVGTIGDITLTVGAPPATVDVAANFDDPDDQSLAFAARSGDRTIATASASSSMVTVTAIAEGTATITVTAIDEDDLAASQTFTVTVDPAPTPEPTEQAPVPVGKIGNITLTVDASPATVDVAANFDDPDDQSLAFAARSGDRTIATALTSGSSTVTVTAIAEGTTTITVTAIDEDGLTASQTFTVTVNPAPIPEPPPSTVARVSISSTPSNAYITINGDTGNVRTPATLDLPPGTHDLTIHKPGVGRARGSMVVDAGTESNLHITLDSTETDRFPTLRGSRGGSSTWTFTVGSSNVIDLLPFGQGGDPPLTMQFENPPPGMTYELVTSDYTGPWLVISWAPTREGTFAGSYQVVDSDGDTFSFPVSLKVVPYQPGPCDKAMNADPTICECQSDGTVVIGIRKCLPVTGDPRCPYPVKMAEGGSGSLEPQRLLAQVSAKGTLCATANAGISLAALDKVSRMSTAMLQHRRDLIEWSLAVPAHHRSSGGDVIVLYGEGERWCRHFPPIYTDQYCGGPPRFTVGIYAKPIILCPENDLTVCVHEIAHAVYDAANRSGSVNPRDESLNERRPVIDRFAESDVRDLWDGYALENENEFFAEMSAIYFCVGSPSTLPKLHCAAELRRHDPKTYDVIHGIYRGSADLR